MGLSRQGALPVPWMIVVPPSIPAVTAFGAPPDDPERRAKGAAEAARARAVCAGDDSFKKNLNLPKRLPKHSCVIIPEEKGR